MPERRHLANAVLGCVVPVCLYLPLITINGELQVHGGMSSTVGDVIWAVIWLGSVAVGYAMFARRLGPSLLVAIVYVPAMLALLGYLGLVTGLFLYGDGP